MAIELSMLGQIADDRQAQIQEALKQAEREESETKKFLILKKSIDDVRDMITEKAVSQLGGDVSVSNLDEIKAHLRNELNRIAKPVVYAIEKLKLDKTKLESVKKEIMAENALAVDRNYDIQVIKKPNQSIRVDNLDDIILPNDIRINNLDDLKQYFESINKVIKETFSIDVPTPQVTVEPTPVTVQPVEVNVPEVNFKPLIDKLDSLKFLSDKPTKPVSVRLSDGKSFIKELQELSSKQDKMVQAFSGSNLNGPELRKAIKAADVKSNLTSGSKALSDATTAVQVTATSTKIDYVDLTVTGGPVAVGDSSAVATSGSEVGVMLYPASIPYRMSINNLNKLYAAGAAGTRLCYVYYS